MIRSEIQVYKFGVDLKVRNIDIMFKNYESFQLITQQNRRSLKISRQKKSRYSLNFIFYVKFIRSCEKYLLVKYIMRNRVNCHVFSFRRLVRSDSTSWYFSKMCIFQISFKKITYVNFFYLPKSIST